MCEVVSEILKILIKREYARTQNNENQNLNYLRFRD